MSTIHNLFFMSHILVGSMALLLFWAPLVTKKGSIDHIKFGRYYGNIMYLVAFTGAVMALMVIYDPMAIKGEMFRPGSDRERFTGTIRVFWGFLLFLSLLTYVSVRQGFAVLKHKGNIAELRKPLHVIPLVALVVGGVFMLVLGIQASRILHIIFGILGAIIGTGMLRFCFKKHIDAGQWVSEHLSAMIGSGIGAYTAFLAFGGRQLFENIGSFQIIFWIAPGVIGSIAITLLSRKYDQNIHNVRKPK